MRTIALALVAAALGFGGLAAVPAPAEAQGITLRIGGPSYYHRPHTYRRTYYRPAYYRPTHYRPAYYAPRCGYRVERYWTGFGWAHERRRVCW